MADNPTPASLEQQLFEAIRARDVDTARELLQRDPSLGTSIGLHGHRVLYTAVREGGPAITELLLQSGADPNTTDSFGNTPLHAAVDASLPAEEIVACLGLLLDRDADPGALNHNGHTPRRNAIWRDNRPAAELLQERGAPLAGRRPVWEAPDRIVRLVEQILTRSWNGPVTLGRCFQLRGDRVLRFEIAGAPDVQGRAAPATVAVKQARGSADNPYNPEATERYNSAWGLFGDWAGTQLFSSLPNSGEYALRFYGGAREAGVIVIEDLGDGESLVDRLMGDDPRRAEEGLRMLAECLGRLHADTIGHEERYQAFRDALGPRLGSPRPGPLEGHRAELDRGFQAAEIEPAPGFDEDFTRVAAAWADPGPFLAYVHGDPCPDNCRIAAARLRLFDFETGGFRHAMMDAVYGRMTFPTCWCCNRLPAYIAPMMEAAYRAQLVRRCPAAEDDDRFNRELLHACASWLLCSGAWMMERALKEDDQWGISSTRQRVLLRLDAFADTTEQFDYLPAMGATARRCTARLRELWPADADAMPLYPAFRGDHAAPARG
jgi:hypothetical protein